jgi:hypothetical protein
LSLAVVVAELGKEQALVGKVAEAEPEGWLLVVAHNFLSHQQPLVLAVAVAATRGMAQIHLLRV